MNSFVHRMLKTVALAAFLTGVFLPANVRATAFVYKFNQVFDGMTPTGAAPWISATFSDVSTGKVQLTIAASDLSSGEFLSSLFLNLDPSDSPGKLNFTYVSGSGGFAVPTVATGNNKFKADGDGKYDIDFTFSQKSAKTFTGGEFVTFDITGTGFTLDANDFDSLSKASAGSSGPFLAAAQIMGIPGCDTSTGWIAPCSLTPLSPTPEPASVSLLALGAVAWAASRRFSVRSKKV